jgi:hypothetical protein
MIYLCHVKVDRGRTKREVWSSLLGSSYHPADHTVEPPEWEHSSDPGGFLEGKYTGGLRKIAGVFKGHW